MKMRQPAPPPVRLRAAFLAATGMLLAPAAVPAAPAAAPPALEVIDAASRSAVLAAALLAVVILLPVAFLAYRRFHGPVRGAPGAPPQAANPLAEAEMEERRGNFAAAASRYEEAGDLLRAGTCLEQAQDLPRAAECFEAAGELERAATLHVRSGGSLRAAGIYLRTKNYPEAAKIFRDKGDHVRAAQALELCGDAAAAAREYSAAGNHARAVRLLEEERRYAEAAEAYRPLLGGAEVTARNAEQHTTYAALLALAGERERAVAAYRTVLAAVPGHLRAASGLQALLTRPPAAAPGPRPEPRRTPVRIAPGDIDLEVEELEPAAPQPASRTAPPAPGATLRSLMHAGGMEPRSCMRLWVRALRALAARHRAGVVFGCLTPESITADAESNIRIAPPPAPAEPYASPEVRAGLPPHRQADIYSLGVILYELLTGGTEELGRRRASQLAPGVPAWLDELIERCTGMNATQRFRTTEEVSAALLRLRRAR